MFLSYLPGQGLHKGFYAGSGVELYAIKFRKYIQTLKIDFYYDKVLKWIPSDQMILPCFNFDKERVEIHV
jgi:hypothetical protein